MSKRAPYSINLDAAFGPLKFIDVPVLAGVVEEQWCKQTLVRVNDRAVRPGVLQREFHWHRHGEADEIFYVVDGRFLIDLEEADRAVEFAPR